MHISCQFSHLDSEPSQTLAQLLRHFSGQGFHWRDVHNLEVFCADNKIGGIRLLEWIGRNVLCHCVQYCEHSSIRLTGTSGSADKHVLAAVICDWMNQTLHAIERLVTLEGTPAETVHFTDLHELPAAS